MRCAAVDVVDINSKWKIHSKHTHIPWNTYTNTQFECIYMYKHAHVNTTVQRSCNCEWNHSAGFACFLSLNHFCCWIHAFSPFLYPTNSFIQSSFFSLNLTIWSKFILWRAYFTLWTKLCLVCVSPRSTSFIFQLHGVIYTIWSTTASFNSFYTKCAVNWLFKNST